MEVPNPHSGGLPSASRWVPLSGTLPPPTPTPIYRGAPRALEMPAELELDLSNSEYSRAPSRASSRSSRSTRSTQSIRSAQGIRKRGQLGLNLDHGRNLCKQCQALAESLENQELERQIELETIQAYIDQRLEAQIAQQRAREQQYEARIEALEKQVQKLQQAQATQATVPTGIEPVAAQTAPQTTAFRGPHGPLTPQRRRAEFSTHRPHSRAAPKAPGPSKPHATYADITALLNTNPGGQGWQTVTKKRHQKTPKSQTDILPSPQLKAAKRTPLEARRLIFRRENSLKASQAECADIILGLNTALTAASLPDFLRVVDVGYTRTGAISIILQKGSLNHMLLSRYTDLMIAAVRKIDPAVISLEAPEQWYRLKVHGVPIKRYLTLGLGLARQEIETGSAIRLKRDPTWLKSPESLRNSIQKGSSIVITVGSLAEAQQIQANGIRFGGTRYKVEHFWELGPDTVCPRCCGIGHKSFRACGGRPPKCYICAGPHEGLNHACSVLGCSARAGKACQHTPARCGNCGGRHPALAASCPSKRAARKHRNQASPILPNSPAVQVGIRKRPRSISAPDSPDREVSSDSQISNPRPSSTLGTPQTAIQAPLPSTPRDQVMEDPQTPRPIGSTNPSQC
jgi:hypothetical protein